jgi:membrane associated rhomboid family serine protease
VFIILPYRTSIYPRKKPYANYALIIANVVIFILQYHINPLTGQLDFRAWVTQFMLVPERPSLWQFVSYAFLHGGLLHIGGNMFFLYLFGNNVNDKLGNIGYLCFYLAGAVFSGIGHVLVGGGNILGASGAIAAVTGAYLVLFPQTLIKVVYWIIFFIGTVELPALYFIALKMIIIDNVILRYTNFVAYDAHLSGYAFGILSMVGMLAAGLISSSQFDLWAMLRQWNRRRVYNDVVSAGYNPFMPINTGTAQAGYVNKTEAQIQNEEKIQQLRNEISSRIMQRNLPAAADVYLELLGYDSQQVLPRQQLLDIANQLAGEKRYAEAARAYVQFLANYGSYEYAEQVELMLGLLYSRYLNQPEPALKHLQAAVGRLSDPGQLKMCRDEIAHLQK